MSKFHFYKYTFWVLTALIIFCAGCSPLIRPPAYQVPEVEKQGDGQIEVLTGVTTLSAQGAFSPANHFVITGAYNNNIISRVGQKGNDYSYQGFGLGYYTTGNKIQVGVLARYGWGMGRDNTLRTENGIEVPYYVQANYHSYQLQPYVKLPVESYSAFYFGFRNSVVLVTSFGGNDDTRVNPGSHYTFEPFGGFRIGTPELKFDIQAGLYSPKSSYSSKDHPYKIKDTDGLLNINIGISYNFGSKGKSPAN